jgi:hypothetical protein
MTRTARSPVARLAFGSAPRATSFCVALALLCAYAACNAEPEKDDAADAGTSSPPARGNDVGAVITVRDGGDASAAGAGGSDAQQPRDSSAAGGGADASSMGAPASGYTIAMCPGRTPNELPQRPACDGEIRCGAAHCVPSESLSETQLARTPDCSAGKCIPDQLARAGAFRFQPCTGELGEGRCIPQCFALWSNPLSAIFAVGKFGCGKEEVCAPCVDPTDQSPSGVCTGDPCATDAAD